MKTRFGTVLIALSLGSFTTITADMFPPVDLTCNNDKEIIIFENNTKSDASLIIQGTDHCAGRDSLIIVHTPGSLPTLKLPLPDGTTKTFSVTVAPSMKVGFQCNGQGTGKCMYVISKQ